MKKTDKLKSQSLDDLIKNFKSRISYGYYKTTGEYDFPNSYDGDCLMIAKEIIDRLDQSERQKYLDSFKRNNSI